MLIFYNITGLLYVWLHKDLLSKTIRQLPVPELLNSNVDFLRSYTVGTESIQTPLNFSLFVILQPFAKII